jgi:hypothetical protein
MVQFTKIICIVSKIYQNLDLEWLTALLRYLKTVLTYISFALDSKFTYNVLFIKENINTINLLLENTNDNKYCKWGHFVVSPDFNSVQ